jgi:hypothetical protein
MGIYIYPISDHCQPEEREEHEDAEETMERAEDSGRDPEERRLESDWREQQTQKVDSEVRDRDRGTPWVIWIRLREAEDYGQLSPRDTPHSLGEDDRQTLAQSSKQEGRRDWQQNSDKGSGSTEGRRCCCQETRTREDLRQER